MTENQNLDTASIFIGKEACLFQKSFDDPKNQSS